jgi:type IV pilus assembly protein PilB
MGVEPFLVTASVNLILAQRLARKICAGCKAQTESPAHDALVTMGFAEEIIPSARFFRGQGCRDCNGTGYRGRVALYEVMPFGDELKQMVLEGCSTAELKSGAIRSGMQTLRVAGLGKVLAETTTTEEVLRVTAADNV